MSTTNILRRTSVFIPCFLASLSREFSSTSSSRVFDARFEVPCRSTRGSPLQAAPTSHHLPLVSAECRSSKLTRRGSCATTEQCGQPCPTARKDEMSIQCRVLFSPLRNFFKRSVTSPPACCVAARLTLLFFKFISVSNMKRVLELWKYFSEGDARGHKMTDLKSVSVSEVLLCTIWTISFKALGSSWRSCCPESTELGQTKYRGADDWYVLRNSLSNSSTTNSVSSADRRLRIMS